MPKKIKIDRNKFVDAYQCKNSCGADKYIIDDLAKIFRMSRESVNNYRKKFGLSRNKIIANNPATPAS
jgi:hypothetical protein